MADHLKTILRFATRLPVHAALALIAVYQRTLSPVLPALFGPGCGCRFTPTCSHYAAGALRTHGFFAGLFLAARRLVKCTPLHPGGHDPIPLSLSLTHLWRRSELKKLWRTSRRTVPPSSRPACVRWEREQPKVPPWPIDWLRALSRFDKLKALSMPRGLPKRLKFWRTGRRTGSERLGVKPLLLRSLMRTTEDTVHLGSPR
jgi:putative membrane protein insertion efficiency factor